MQFRFFRSRFASQGDRWDERSVQEDRRIWNEFRNNIATLGTRSEEILHDLFATRSDEEVDLLQADGIHLESDRSLNIPGGPTESTATVKVRRGQQFFRQSILSAYGLRCCISGINIPSLLVASHIKPWRDFPEERLDPRNGLCLSNLHDAAFDEGLITLDNQLRVILSKRLRAFFPQPTLEDNFIPFEGRPISLPDKLAEPATEFIDYHRRIIFKQ